ncbi:MAG: MAPEG family protein [Alphaproteobacteria bacterium]|nr:MAPEG family protein [Alphaproteobacteria bacterium]
MTLTIELACAAGAIGLGLLQLTLTAIELRRVHGLAWANTARDQASGKADSPLLGRLQRAQSNLMETLPHFIGIILIIHVAGLSGVESERAAIVFLAARVVYLPLYAFGVPWLRGLVWGISFVALIGLAYIPIATFLMS